MWWLAACEPAEPTGDRDTDPPAATTADTGTSTPETGTSGSTGHTGATGGDTGFDPDLELELFPRDRVLEVQVEMAPADWDTLRFQDRPLVDAFTGECLAAPFVSPYTEFPSVVTIDGVVLPDVNVRKKGFIGSVTSERPSLKLDLDDLVPGRDVSGFDRLTLNNQLQDPSAVRSCLAAEALRLIGVPGARCSLAHVTVNGLDLGLYAHLEDIEKGVLPAWSLDGGQVYEGSVSDFVDGFVHTLEPENDETLPGLELPLQVVAALEGPDATLEAELGRVVDLPAVYAFWAAEALLAHNDGFSAHRNNFYAVWPPKGGMALVPSGLEATFGWDPNLPEPGTAYDIQTDATLFWRLQEVEDTREAFLDVLDAKLALWDESALGAELDRLAALVAPYLDPTELDTHVRNTRDFVDGREFDLRVAASELDRVRVRPPPSMPCLAPGGAVSLTFDTTFGTLGEPGERTGTSSVTGPDGTFVGGAIAGFSGGGFVLIELFGRDGLRATEVEFQLDEPLATAGWSPIPVGTMSNMGMYERSDQQPGGVRVAYLAGGTLVLDAMGTSPGDPVRGSFQGSLSLP